MLRVHCIQLLYNLSDPAMKDALYEIESMRRFAGLKITDEIPDESTILNFRHLLERHKLGRKLFNEINAHLSKQGFSLKEGTIVDTSIITSSTSTENKEGKRDKEMRAIKVLKKAKSMSRERRTSLSQNDQESEMSWMLPDQRVNLKKQKHVCEQRLSIHLCLLKECLVTTRFATGGYKKIRNDYICYRALLLT